MSPIGLAWFIRGVLPFNRIRTLFDRKRWSTKSPNETPLQEDQSSAASFVARDNWVPMATSVLMSKASAFCRAIEVHLGTALGRTRPRELSAPRAAARLPWGNQQSSSSPPTGRQRSALSRSAGAWPYDRNDLQSSRTAGAAETAYFCIEFNASYIGCMLTTRPFLSQARFASFKAVKSDFLTSLKTSTSALAKRLPSIIASTNTPLCFFEYFAGRGRYSMKSGRHLTTSPIIANCGLAFTESTRATRLSKQLTASTSFSLLGPRPMSDVITSRRDFRSLFMSFAAMTRRQQCSCNSDRRESVRCGADRAVQPNGRYWPTAHTLLSPLSSL